MSDLETRFWNKVHKQQPPGCWEWSAGRNTRGYGWFGNVFGRAQLAHRVAWILVNGEVPGDLCVLHRCDNPICVNPDHLFLGTRRDNNNDKCAKNRQYRGIGEINGRAKLTEQDVRSVRSRCAAGETMAAVARSLGVTEGTVAHIIKGRTWTNVP